MIMLRITTLDKHKFWRLICVHIRLAPRFLVFYFACNFLFISVLDAAVLPEQIAVIVNTNDSRSVDSPIKPPLIVVCRELLTNEATANSGV